MQYLSVNSTPQLNISRHLCFTSPCAIRVFASSTCEETALVVVVVVVVVVIVVVVVVVVVAVDIVVAAV